MRILLFLAFYWQICGTIYSWKFPRGRSNWKNLGAPKGADLSDIPDERWFTQKLNHFSPQDTRTWKQRYYVNEEFFDVNDNRSPVFLMIGGEGPAEPRWMVKGAWIEYAKKLNALCVMVEHRYYGKSHPLPDMSVKNLKYLSSRQALADLANFIETFNENSHFKNRKWIMFGGSYPGSLAAWMRLKYPHLVFASVSSSGPLEAVVDFQDYYRVVVDALIEKTDKLQCVNQVKLAHKQITALMNLEPHTVENIFKLCKPLGSASELDIKTFHNSIADFFAGVVQYNEDNRMVNGTDRTNVTINTVCDMLTSPGAEAFKNLGGVARMLLEMDKQTCLNYSYADAINDLRQDQWTPEPASERQWFYQTCTEFGFYQTSTGEWDVFGDDFDVHYFTRQCADVFGEKFNDTFIRDAVEATNQYYGGKNIRAERVLYVHGSVDPWHALGLLEATDSSSPVIYIKGTAHCANMYPSADSDLPALTAARSRIYDQLWDWIYPIF